MDKEIGEARVGSAEAVRPLTRNAPATRHPAGRAFDTIGRPRNG